MKKFLISIVVLTGLLLLIAGIVPPKVILHNSMSDNSLTIENKGLIETLIAPLETVEKDVDRIKTPCSNTLTIYKGFLPIKRVSFGMPSIFTEERVGQVIILGKPYKIDGTFYHVLAKIEKEKNFTLDTL